MKQLTVCLSACLLISLLQTANGQEKDGSKEASAKASATLASLLAEGFTEVPGEGSYAQNLGGKPCTGYCNLYMRVAPSPIYAKSGDTITVYFKVDPTLGGPNFNIHSGGVVDWGDNQTSPFQTSVTAGSPYSRLTSTIQTLTHKYDQAGIFKISAWMQGDYKYDGSGSCSYRCRAQQSTTVYVKLP